jgi:cellulose synthase (UDP-forming)
MDGSIERPGNVTRLFRTLVLCVTTFLLVQLISLDLSWPKQAILGGVSIFLGLALNRLSSSRVVTLALMLVSMTATLRYAWWRVNLVIDFFSDESNHRAGIDSAFILLLLSTEAYTILIMVLGYMQTMWPLKRKSVQLLHDETQWPHVDVLIPTYNEPLSLVRYTALAAINIDYPTEKLHVYILDDGTREDFREFAQAAGVGYITRVKHDHAKAGNINHALSTMNSEFVAIFDCDHVPTRSFLQMTLGWMLVDPLLAMLQTPHHFYSPDPFERNLLQYKTIPNEGALFYGLVQDGNDFWNATFFCGSCAVLRRSVLDEVGGIAIETVTEDAHTSLRMQKRGYNTAYINIPQAAGLATETLAAHVGQRIRWARGMIQIFRIDNPLFARGMKFAQRLCYLNAMIHFLYAVPRLVFLCAPLVYMLLGRTIIPGYWAAILVFALPHLLLSSLTNSRIQGRYRHSYWNEIYEAVLAPYILAPTLLALINPKLGRFNVTDKGSTLSETHFDKKITMPTRWMLFLNFLGILMAPYRIFIKDSQHPGTVIMNLIWVLFNIVILGVAAAVAHEQKQRRQSVRIEARIPMRIELPDGRQIPGMSVDMSIGGATMKLAYNAPLVVGDTFRVVFPLYAGDDDIGARVVGLDGEEIRLEFLMPTIAEQETLTRTLYSRANAWINAIGSKEVDQPLKSLGRIIRLSFYGIHQIFRSYLPEKSPPGKAGAAHMVAPVLIAFILGASIRVSGSCLPPQGSRATNAAGKESSQSSSPVGPRDVGSRTSSIPVTQSVPPHLDDNANDVQVLSLKDMGLVQAFEMRGPHSYDSIQFVLSHALVPKRATLKLFYSFEPGLDPHTTSLKISLNGFTIATILPGANSELSVKSAESDVLVPPDLLVRNNSFAFNFEGSGVMQRDDQAKTHILGRISLGSTLEVSGDRLAWQNDLSQLPLPFFDSDLQTMTTLPFVFLSPPDPQALEGAGIVASWFGLLASSKPVRFTVALGQIPPGNAIIFADNRSMLPSELQIPAGAGPLLALRDNPSDAGGKVLILAGDDGEQLLTVARTLSLLKGASATTPAQGTTLGGDTAQIPDLVMPAARERDDAPRWLPTRRETPLTDCRTPDALQSDGSKSIPLYLHTPPDLFYGERQNLKLNLHYRYNAIQVTPGSALRVLVNDKLVSEVALSPGTDFTDRLRQILVPVADLQPFGNTILFNFDFAPSDRDTPGSLPASAPMGQILCSSSLELQGLAFWTSMPNLGIFASAGFPFTKLADLSETTVVLPAVPGKEEISLYLHLLSHFGAETGYPALRVIVSGPNTVISRTRDYLILGSIDNQPAFNSLDPLLPATLDSNGVHVSQMHSSLPFISSTGLASPSLWSRWIGRATKQTLPSNFAGVPDALVEEIESPSSPDRSIVLVILNRNTSASTFADVFLDAAQSRDIAGSVSLLRNAKFESYPMEGETYRVGDISRYAMMRIWFTHYFLLLLVLVTALSLLVAGWLREWLSQRARARLQVTGTVRAAN